MSPESSLEGNFERATLSNVYPTVNHNRLDFGRLISIWFCIMLRHMPLTEDIITSRYAITGYEDDSVKINDTSYRSSLVLSADSLHHPWPIKTVNDIDEAFLATILGLKPDVVLLGTGRHQQFPEARIFGLFGQKGIGLEVMDNGALCRTFNILVAEDRAVVAAILLGS